MVTRIAYHRLCLTRPDGSTQTIEGPVVATLDEGQLREYHLLRHEEEATVWQGGTGRFDVS